jgi:hypothetical protein
MIVGYESRSRRLWVENLAVLAAVAAFYIWLLSPIRVDDAQRYIDELSANQFFWDLGHVWMQPLALLFHRLTRGALGIVGSLEAVNVMSVAVGCAVFYDLLRRCGHSIGQAALACLLVASSFNILTLGPTAHIKLLVFPALALSLRHAVLWERALDEGKTSVWHGVAAGWWLGVGANLLVSVLPAGLFMVLLMLVHLRLQRYGWLAAIGRVLPCALAMGVAGAGLLLLAYVTASASGSSHAANFMGFVFGGLKEKQDLHVGLAGWREVPFRFLFALTNNFIYLPSLGQLGRAWLWHMLPDISPAMRSLLVQAGAAALTLSVIVAAVFIAARKLFRPGAGLLMATAFVVGAASFSIYYNLNDPEHWFQFTLPLIFLALQAGYGWLRGLTLAVWLPVLLTVNMAGYGVPKALFKLEQRQQEMAATLGAKGLYVGYAAYPGEPDSSLFDLGGIERFPLDLVLEKQAQGNTARLFELLDQRVAETFQRGGRVLVFRAVDTLDWRGPAMQMALGGMTQTQLRTHLGRKFEITGPFSVGGFPAWELKPLEAAQ